MAVGLQNHSWDPSSTHSTLHPGGTANPPRPLPIPLLRHKEMGHTSRVRVHSCWPASTDTLMEASCVCRPGAWRRGQTLGRA